MSNLRDAVADSYYRQAKMTTANYEFNFKPDELSLVTPQDLNLAVKRINAAVNRVAKEIYAMGMSKMHTLTPKDFEVIKKLIWAKLYPILDDHKSLVVREINIRRVIGTAMVRVIRESFEQGEPDTRRIHWEDLLGSELRDD